LSNSSNLNTALNGAPPPPLASYAPQFVEDDTPELFTSDVFTATTEPAAPPIAPLRADSKRAQRARESASSVPKRQRYTWTAIFSGVRALAIIFTTAVLVATIFAGFTANDLLSVQAQRSLAVAQAAEIANAPQAVNAAQPVLSRRIGILPGHSGMNPTSNLPDPGAVCPDGFSEAEVTRKVGEMVIAQLRARGYTVDELQEWDARLSGYDASVFLSIHADSCVNFQDNYKHNGFKVVNPEGRQTVRDQDLRLVDCLRNDYSTSTGLPFSGWTVTNNMLYYHAFHQVTQRTPAAIIELGFLYYDRDLLQNHPDKSATGIIDGLLCFLDPRALGTPKASITAAAPAATFLPTVAGTPIPFGAVTQASH